MSHLSLGVVDVDVEFSKAAATPLFSNLLITQKDKCTLDSIQNLIMPIKSRVEDFSALTTTDEIRHNNISEASRNSEHKAQADTLNNSIMTNLIIF